jgi:hypothetical protein
MLPAISRVIMGGATGPYLMLLAAIWACGARQPGSPQAEPGPEAPRLLPLARVIVLETSGPPPPDTSVTFPAGTQRTIVLYHAGENITFAKLEFEPGAFADSGRMVQVDVRPRPGVYGLDFSTSLPLQANRSAVAFEYSRYFSEPAQGRQRYGSDVAFERALAVGRLLPEAQVELLPSTRPAGDNLRAMLPVAGGYIVAAPQ